MSLNQNAELALVNTQINAGTINLPLASSIPGRVLSFKDSNGTFGTNGVTVNTSGSDTFEDGGTSKVLKETYGSIQLVASGNKWYILNGTQVNTIQVSTLITNAISSFNISSVNIYISTLSFIDDRLSTNLLNVSTTFASTQNISTNFLYYNNYVVAGTRIGYSNVLNKNSFSPLYINGLALWFDSSDSNYVKTNGSNVTQWLDKSQYANHSQVLTTNFPQVSTLGSVSLSTIVFNGTNTLFTIPISFSYDNSSGPYVLAVVCKPYYGGNNLTQINGVLGRNIGGVSAQLGLNTRGFTTSMGFYFLTPGGLNEFTWTQSAQQLFVAQRTSLTPVSVYNTGTLFVNNQTGGYLSNNTPFTLGYNVSGLGNSYYNGELCEVLFYNSLLTNFQRQQVEGYLAWKWGLQANLPASHPFFNAPPQ